MEMQRDKQLSDRSSTESYKQKLKIEMKMQTDKQLSDSWGCIESLKQKLDARSRSQRLKWKETSSSPTAEVVLKAMGFLAPSRVGLEQSIVWFGPKYGLDQSMVWIKVYIVWFRSKYGLV